MYPIFLKLKGKKTVIIGAGQVAIRKAQSLIEAQAKVLIVTDKIADDVRGQIPEGIEIIESGYLPDHLTEAVIAIAATNDHDLNERIYKDCNRLGILCNVVDEPDMCDFFVPAVVKRGELNIAVSTSGLCPGYAGQVREMLEEIFTEEHTEFLKELSSVRKIVIEKIPCQYKRKAVIEKLTDRESFSYFSKNGPKNWRSWAEDILDQTPN